jgi:cytochrome c oxidase subunit I+III
MAQTTTAPSRDRFAQTWVQPRGLRGFFTAVSHKPIGQKYMVTAFVLFLVGGVEALLLRVQLAQPENDFLSADAYNQLFTMHGTTMMFLFVIPFLEGLASYLLPVQLGARDLPFPRYNAFNYWCYLFGGIILYSSVLVAMVPDAGWFAYVPLSGPEFTDKAMDFWLFGLTLAELSAIGAAIEIGVGILRTRAPGMSLDKMPIFAWAMLGVSFLVIVAFVPLLVASVMLELERVAGTVFFDPSAGGDPLLWQHLFWIFGHPEVYVMFLPAAGIISHVLQVHSGRPLAAYALVVLAIVVTAVISLGLWVHHMFTVGLPPLTLSFFTAASMTITLASGLQVFAWIATMWLGRPRLTVSMMYAIGFLLTFVAGGITGVMVASVAFDTQVHDTFFVVAHFHYVLIGGVLFPIFAGLYHWWPKLTGKVLDNRLGHLSFWLVFLGFHTTFFPLHLAGLWGMPRRVFTYPEELDLGPVNLLATIGALTLATGVLVFTTALVLSLVRGRQAASDPWGGDSLEWAVASPPPSENHATIPVVAGRHPVWEPVEDGRYDDFRCAFDHRPEGFRATPMTSVLTAEPAGVARLATPTFWPFVPALGLAVLAAGMLASAWWILVLGGLVLLTGLAGWALTNEAAQDADDEQDLVVGGHHLEAPGSAALGWWGAGGAAVVALVAAVTGVFSALYLQVNAAAWPSEGTMNQPVLFDLVAVGLLVATVATRRASRSDATHTRSGHMTAAAVALVAGVAALVLLVAAGLVGELSPTRHAYDSVVLFLLGAQGLLVVGVLAMTGAAVLGRRRHTRHTRSARLLEQTGILWATSLVTWVLVWITVDLLPVVI